MTNKALFFFNMQRNSLRVHTTLNESPLTVLQWGPGKVHSRSRAKSADFGKSADFSFEICRFACGTFLDRSRWVLGVGGSYLNLWEVYNSFLGKLFFVVSSSAAGSRKVLHIDMT